MKQVTKASFSSPSSWSELHLAWSSDQPSSGLHEDLPPLQKMVCGLYQIDWDSNNRGKSRCLAKKSNRILFILTHYVKSKWYGSSWRLPHLPMVDLGFWKGGVQYGMKACAKIMCMFCLNFETDPLQEKFYGNHARYKWTVDGSINPRRVSLLLP